MLEAISLGLQGNNFTLLVISIHNLCIESLRTSLEERIRQSPHILAKNTPVVINVSTINNKFDWDNIYKIISDTGLLIIGVCCCHDNKLKNIITQNKVPILTKGNQNKTFGYHKFFCNKLSVYKNSNTSETVKTQIIDKPIRSGQKVYARNKDLIIISNVSAGAEVIADGNIHIYGIMRGRVLAGASGDEKSQIFCSNLIPELVSIGGYYWLIDQIPQKFLGKSARFYLKNKTLIIQHIL